MISPSLQHRSQPDQQPASSSRASLGSITELVLTHNAPDQTCILLPMLAHLSHSNQDRWLTWISPGPIDRQLLDQYGVDASKLRLIHIPSDQDSRWVVWQALAEGNSHTVIASPGLLGDREIARFEEAALAGNCQGLMLRLRQH